MTDDVTRRLDLAVRPPSVREALDRLAATAERELHEKPGAHLAWCTVPLDLYESLPHEIASSWVFVLRANSTSGAERHPNSIQRFMSLRNEGDMQTWTGTEWQSHVLRTDDDAPFDERVAFHSTERLAQAGDGRPGLDRRVVPHRADGGADRGAGGTRRQSGRGIQGERALRWSSRKVG
jgi:hypothetical protein